MQFYNKTSHRVWPMQQGARTFQLDACPSKASTFLLRLSSFSLSARLTLLGVQCPYNWNKQDGSGDNGIEWHDLPLQLPYILHQMSNSSPL